MAARPDPQIFTITILRIVLAGNDALLWICALVVCAVQASLIAHFPDGSGAHNVYALSIVRGLFRGKQKSVLTFLAQAALCVWFYTMGIIGAFLRRNNGYFAPIDVIFAILFVDASR
jgi:hypothetical protein